MTAEFMRRAALAYEADDAAEEAELRALLNRFEQMHDVTLAQLDRTDLALDAALAHLAEKRA